MFDVGLLESNLEYKKKFNKIIYFPSTQSTNNEVWGFYQKAPKKYLIITDNQTAGRGRGLNRWFSTMNKSITCSFVLNQIFPVEKFNFHSLVVPISIVRGVKKYLSLDLKIKWPNDIVYNGFKVGGILIETRKYSGKHVFNIGIGVNVNETPDDLKNDIKKKSISLKMISGYEIQREPLLANIFNELWNIINYYNTKKITKAWLNHCNHINHNICFKHNQQSVEGRFKNINNNGQAIIEFKNQLVSYDGAIECL